MTDNPVDQCVEIMCRKGCKALWDDIGALENGVTLPEVAMLSSAQSKQVLKELKAIMAVYDNSGSCVTEILPSKLTPAE